MKQECEDTSPPPGFETYSKGDITYVRGRGVVCIVGSRKSRPGFCMDMIGVIMRSKFERELERAPLPRTLRFVAFHLDNRSMNDWNESNFGGTAWSIEEKVRR